MKFLFYPAIALMNRLGYTKKFALLGLLFLIAIGILTYSLFVSLDAVIRTSQRQLDSIALIRPISRTVQVIQLHRGLSAALLGGNQTMRDRHAVAEKEAVEAFDTLEEKLPANLRRSEDWRSIRANWESLLKKGLNWTTAENFTAHTHLISQIQLFTVILTQDTETGLFYLVNIATSRLPDMIEYMGRIRAYGTGILAAKQITEVQKAEVRGMIANLDNALTPLKINFDNAARHNPALQDALLTASRDISDTVMQIVALLESDILTGHFTTSPEDFLMVISAVIDDSYAHIYESLLPSIETQINARIARAENALRVSIGIAFLLFLVVVYFSIGSYYATVGSIESLARSARAFAGGDLRARIDLGTHDELRQVGDSFNEMADGFSALLEARKHAEELLATENRKNEALLRTASDGIHILDLDGNVVQVNDSFCRMLGYTAAELLTMNAAQWDAQLTADQIKANIAALDNNPVMLEARHRRRDGSIIDVDVSIAKVDIEGQQLVYCSSRDATERKQTEAKILNLAYYDTLTGLPNRTLFYDRLAQEIKKAHRVGLKMALLFIDLDKFKEVNDTLGHSMGDLLLLEAAQRISSCVREADTVARLGGDEFIVILSELDGASNFDRV
ncbi:MAG: diguanylate cyclase, partial [Gallionella sp.]|nr:diguanylate cyclase [Gallionella sp.]